MPKSSAATTIPPTATPIQRSRRSHTFAMQQQPEHDRDDDQDREAGQCGVHVGVGQPGHRAAVGRGQLERPSQYDAALSSR